MINVHCSFLIRAAHVPFRRRTYQYIGYSRRHHEQPCRGHAGSFDDGVDDDREADDAEDRGRPGIAPGAERRGCLAVRRTKNSDRTASAENRMTPKPV